MEPTNKVIAIIPARGGSKGIPRKNIRPIANKPLIAFTIEAALQSEYISDVYVSSDDDEILDTASKFGALIIRRPYELADDQASSETTLIHALQYIGQQGNELPAAFAFLQCTSPLSTTEDISGTIQKLFETGADCAFAAARFHGFIWAETDQAAKGVNHSELFRQRRQDRQPEFIEAGSVYVMRTMEFLKQKNRFFGKIALHEIPIENVLEIDEPADFEKASALISARINQLKTPVLPGTIEAIIFDFDGVFTNNKVIVYADGTEAVVCYRGDGMGIELLREKGLFICVISKEKNPVLLARCSKLKLPCYHSVDNKWELLEKIISEKSIMPQTVIYVGKDINDIKYIRNVGFVFAVADAHPSVLASADIILTKKGGEGAIRELSDLIC